MAKKKSMAEKMGIEPWEAMRLDKERVEESVSKMRKALAEDARREMERGSMLPPDWRNRVIRVLE